MDTLYTKEARGFQFWTDGDPRERPHRKREKPLGDTLADGRRRTPGAIHLAVAPLHEYTPQGQTGMQDYYVEYSTTRQAWCVFTGPYKERQHVAGPFALKKKAMDAAKELNNGK